MKAAFVVQPFDRLGPGKQSSSLAILTFELARHLAPYGRVTVYDGADVRGKSELQHQGVHYRYLPVWQDHGLLWRIFIDKNKKMIYDLGTNLLLLYSLRFFAYLPRAPRACSKPAVLPQ